MQKEIQYVAICLRYEVEIGNAPPSYVWKHKNRLYRFEDAHLFSKLVASQEETTTGDQVLSHPEVVKTLDDLAYGRSSDAYQLVPSGRYMDLRVENDTRLKFLVLSHTIDGCVDIDEKHL